MCYSVADLLALGANQVAHWRHIGGVAGEPKAAQFPAPLDGGEHRVVVICHAGGACRVVRVRDGQCDYMASARIGVAAAAGVAEAKGARAGKVALVPGDEDHRVPCPGVGMHNSAHR